MQDDLFGAQFAPPTAKPKQPAAAPEAAEDDTTPTTPRRRSSQVLPLLPDDATLALLTDALAALNIRATSFAGAEIRRVNRPPRVGRTC